MSVDLVYAEKLKNDLVEQFKEKPNIEALCEVIGRELLEVFAFYSDIRDKTQLNTAEGIQIDRLGSIVDLTRYEASRLMESKTLIGDEAYRRMLRYKIVLNTGNGSFDSIIKSMQLLLEDKFTARIKEEHDHPATLILLDDTVPDELLPILLGKYPVPKAAGVGFTMRIPKKDEFDIWYGVGDKMKMCPTYECNEADLGFDKKATFYIGFFVQESSHIVISCRNPFIQTSVEITDEVENTLTDEADNILTESEDRL